MLRRRLLAAATALLAASATRALAGEDGGGRKEVGQYVDLRPVGLPIVVDGRLVNYVFVNIRLNLMSGADTSRWRAKEPYFRDSLVRLGNRTSFEASGNPNAIDAERLAAALEREAVAITGPGVIRSVVVSSQTPSRHLPRPAS
jgi:hypothetical protein